MRIGEVTDNFFNDNKDKLKQNYPGINLPKLKSELCELLKPHSSEVDEFFNSPYVSATNHPVSLFFHALKKGTPLEYISGKKFFYESEFMVTPDVLIPRNETEILVELAIEELKSWNKKTEEPLKLCDIGTGSGCIPLSILRGYGKPLHVLATDVSATVLNIAKKNNFKLRYSYPPESSCDFKCMDRLIGHTEKFHIITSNPPYIKRIEDENLVHHQVMEYEPHLALFLNDEVYDSWFLKLFEDVYEALFDEGVFLMEGHEEHLESLANMAKKMNWNQIKVQQDYCNRNRFLILRK